MLAHAYAAIEHTARVQRREGGDPIEELRTAVRGASLDDKDVEAADGEASGTNSSEVAAEEAATAADEAPQQASSTRDDKAYSGR